MTVETQDILEAAHLLYFVSKENQNESNYSKGNTKRLVSDLQHVNTQDAQDQEDLPNKGKKKKNRNSKTCTFCSAKETPLWRYNLLNNSCICRNGPPEYQILCNRVLFFEFNINR